MEDLVGSSVEQEETSTLMAKESKPTEWTNSKHNLFLKSMEASFVDQLYKSFGLFHKSCTSSGEFKDVRDEWIKQSRCSQRRAIRKFQSSRPRAHLPACDNRDYAESNNAEVTGQNFVDEEISERKRTRTSTNIVSCNDQVVPYSNTVRVE